MSTSSSEVECWPNRAVVFEVWGDYGCFRRFYTTRSPLTFPVPPRPTLAGLIGCIAGIEKDRVSELLADHMSKLAVTLVNPVNTIRLGMNWLDTKEPLALTCGLISQRTQVNIEYLKNPRFRVYVLLRDRVLRETLSSLLQEHKSVYTPCLGMSELLADFTWLGEWEAQRVDDSVADVVSALPTSSVLWPGQGRGVEFESGKSYDRKRVPRVLAQDRAVIEWQDLLVETSARTVRAHVTDLWRVGDDHIVWL